MKTLAAVRCRPTLHFRNMQYNAAQDVYGNIKGN